MAELDENAAGIQRYCAYCGHAVSRAAPPIERFGERFCGGDHAAHADRSSAPCALPSSGQRSWRAYLKRRACWGAPLLLLLAIPLLWSGNTAAVTGGSLLSMLALVACPLGMFFMMRAMGNTGLIEMRRTRSMHRRTFLSITALAGAALIVPRRSTGGPVTTDAIGDQVQTLPKGRLPDFAGPDVPQVHDLYAYAVEHGDELRYIPCFCGCARLGHKSNRDCYIKSFNKDGTLTFTSHAAT
jgi:hypothetical protein